MTSGSSRSWADDIAAFVGATGPYAARAAERAEESRKELTGMFRELTLQRRREPREDLITALAAKEGEEEGLTEQELLGLCVFLFVAGFETTVSLISNGMLLLLQNRGELERLRSDPSLMEDRGRRVPPLREPDPARHPPDQSKTWSSGGGVSERGKPS